MKLHTYLNYGGNCEQAFRFYEKHLSGRVTMMMTQGEQPNAKDVRPDQKDAILYARMSIGQTDLMVVTCHQSVFSRCVAFISPSI
jgi:PhnB protein